MTLDFTKETRIRASVDDTFAALLEEMGPTMMSFAVASNLQYRLRTEGDETVLSLRHTALGLFADSPMLLAAKLIQELEQEAAATRLLASMSDAQVTEHWTVRAGDREILAMPRDVFLRAVFLNHWYHHRGQLTIYLRLLGETVPAIYGPSADENPFAV